MTKFNDAWVLKYSIFRQELQNLLLTDKDKFLDSPIVEISYPKGKSGVRYSKFDFVVPLVDDEKLTRFGMPVFEGCIIQILSRQDKLRLWNYYKLDVHYYGKEEN